MIFIGGQPEASFTANTVLLSCAAKKKNKKGKTLTLTDFLAEDSGGSGNPAPPSYPAKTTSWADETDDLDGDGEHGIEDALLFVLHLKSSSLCLCGNVTGSELLKPSFLFFFLVVKSRKVLRYLKC